MRSQIIEQAENDIQEATASLAELDGVVLQVKQAETAAKSQIKTLQSQLPALLAAQAMGSTEPEISQIKSQIALAKETLLDTPDTLAGVGALKPAIVAKLREAKRVLEKSKKYDLLKERISQNNAISLCSNLRDYAGVLGLEDDCEQFIRGLVKLS